MAVLSAGTDGIDGNSPAAGAVADGETLELARAIGLDPTDALRRSDAFAFFSRFADVIVPGPTGNNLRHLRILIAEPSNDEFEAKDLTQRTRRAQRSQRTEGGPTPASLTASGA